MASFLRGSVGKFFKGDPALRWYVPLYFNALNYSKYGISTTIVNGTIKTARSFRGDSFSCYCDGTLKINVNENITSWGDFTIMCWFKAGAYNGWRQLVRIGGSTNNSYLAGFQLVPSNDGTNPGKLSYWFNAGGDATRYSSGRWDTNRWCFAVFTRQGNILRGYINGLLDLEWTGNANALIPGQEAIAWYRYSTGAEMIGNLSEVAVFTRALSHSEISSYYKWAIGQKKYFLTRGYLFPTSSFLISGQTISKIKTQNSTTLSLSVSESHKLKTISSSSIQFLTTANSKREIPKQLIKDIKTEKINFDIANQP